MSEPAADRLDELSFGRYLQAIRRQRGIHLDTVAQQTRLRVEILRRIEQEALEKLPVEVFVKGFLRAYARAIGADSEEAVKRYLQYNHGPRSGAKVAAKQKATSLLGRFKWLLGGVLLACLLAGAFLMLMRNDGQSAPAKIHQQAPRAQQSTTGTADRTDLQPSADPSGQQRQEASTANAARQQVMAPGRINVSGAETAAAQKFNLKIGGLQDTWLKVIVDDDNAAEYNLNPGDRLDLEARMRINLLIGNAAGVRLTLNGKPYPIQGKAGQVVNVVIP